MRQKASETDADLDEHILLLAVPALLSLLLDPLLTAADTAFVGKSEETLFTEAHRSVFMKVKGENSGLAALAVSSSVFNFISYSGSFLAQATTPLVSREVALEEAKRKNRKNDDENDENDSNVVESSSSASKTISAALALAVVVGVSATFLVETNAEWLLGLSGGNSLEINAYESALEYVKIRALGLPFFCCSLIGIGAFRGVADTRSILNVALVSESVHFFLDWLLVLGLHLGVEGAGWSTFASTVLEFSLFSRAMFDRGILNVPPTRGEEDFFYKQTIKDFLENDVKDMSGKLGQLVSNGSNQLLRTLFLQFVLVRATALATENNVSGPHQIVSQVWWIELFVLDAIAVAAQTLVST